MCQPTPPPKQGKFGFSHKPSFSSFVIPRQGSISNLRQGSVSSLRQGSTSNLRQGSTTNLPFRGRPSDTNSIAESYNSGQSDITIIGNPPGPKRIKSIANLFPRHIIGKRSQSRLGQEADRSYEPPPPMPYLDPSASYTSSSFSTFASASPPSTSSIRQGKRKGKQKASNIPPPLPPKDDELTLDTNLESMEGIIDLTARPSSSNDPMSSSPTSGFDSSFPSSAFSHGGSDSNHPSSTSPTTSMFSNPFPPPSTVAKKPRPPRPVPFMYDKVSPMTQAPPGMPIMKPFDLLDSTAASWEAPESWAVERDGEDPAEPPDYSSSEESVGGGPGRPTSIGPANGIKKNKQHRQSVRPKPPPKTTKQSLSNKAFKVRIYRANNTYHVASIGLTVTVADLTPVLNAKLLLDSARETHRLYLKERGRGK